MNKFSKLLLIVALIFSVSTVCSVCATNYYVGFSSNPVGGVKYSGDVAGLKSALTVAGASDVVYIAKGTYYLDVELTVNTHIIGGCEPTGDGSQRTAIGAAASVTSNMTVLDGNSFRHPRRIEKHRVATVNTNGIIENCLIRNGHARGTTNDNNDLNGHGGGVLLNGGKLYNCIIRGNVAMNVQYQSTNKSSGGGVYITSSGGQIVNCIIAFNMDDKGVGIDGKSGESINNTIAYNTQTPTWVNIPSGYFQPYSETTTTLITNRHIYLNAFYIASTECTNGQYACFMSAIDFQGTSIPYLTVADKEALIAAKAPVPASYTGYPSDITVKDYALLDFGGTTYAAGTGKNPSETIFNLLSAGSVLYGGLATNDNILWYPVSGGTTDNTASGEALRRDNQPMSNVSWWGSLCFCLWQGGCLPTTAQWEYAARQDTSGTNNSYKYAGSNDIESVAWYSTNSVGKVHEVAKKTGTEKGLYDMSGNLWEWCLDAYDDVLSTGAGVLTVVGNTGKDLVSSGSGNGSSQGAAKINPVIISDRNGGSSYPPGSIRLRHGGGWNDGADNSSLGKIGGTSPNSINRSYGFRSVCVP
ncbi:MAG: formylglycine-generating enzyme family protein [Bacteroidales bacterium]|nr:formylglycine-generating enzyme family protein [Bacteroidales bacterium]